MSTAAALPAAPITLYRYSLSGHCHRVECLLSLLQLPYALVEVDLTLRAHKAPWFLALNRFGQVPVIQDGPVTLADSNAILGYLATRYDAGAWLPRAPVAAAAVQRWLSVAAGPLAFGPAAARVAALFRMPIPTEEAVARAHALFTVMDAELTVSPFLAGNGPTIADLAHYAYTAHAPEGHVSLAPYPALRSWLQRLEALPGFVRMTPSPVGLAALR